MWVCQPTRLLQVCQLRTAVLLCCIVVLTSEELLLPLLLVCMLWCAGAERGLTNPQAPAWHKAWWCQQPANVVGSIRYKATPRTCGQNAGQEKAPEAATHPVVLLLLCCLGAS